ncbi:TPA: hypothetical protein SMS45_004358 [Pseudomonas aeruginosa]|nr:hypothetical protein [Pseudomonas aeruginosa]
MKLATVDLSLEEKLSEFDNWITASIQQVSETETYRSELAKIGRILNSLGAATNQFESVESCQAEKMAIYCVAEVEKIISESDATADPLKPAVDLLDSLISMLFLVTGKSDNNLKCQFPVYLFQSEHKTSFPTLRRSRGEVNFEFEELGRVIKQERISKIIGDALVLRNKYRGPIDLEAEAVWLLQGYINTILSGEGSTEQLWALGSCYFSLKQKQPGLEDSLLAPIVAFKVRGSVAAQSGHLPEKILRRFMSSWGLKSGVDFNIDDVIIHGDDLQEGDLIEAAVDLNEDEDAGQAVGDLNADPTKTRAYDFVLPYKTPGWTPSIFLQSQFYAGDSGSVSHKVVDQTRASRILTRAKYPRAIFLEYLDGAGYYSSLHRDLKHMLEMPSTADFIQIRSAHIKLRRALQIIGYLTPLDFVHELLKCGGNLDQAKDQLVSDGYSIDEVSRCYNFCIAENLLINNDEKVSISPRLMINSRRIMLLDIIVIEGAPIDLSCGSVIVVAPGMGSNHGISLHTLGRVYQRHLSLIDSGATRFTLDVEWLNRQGFIKIKTL